MIWTSPRFRPWLPAHLLTPPPRRLRNLLRRREPRNRPPARKATRVCCRPSAIPCSRDLGVHPLHRNCRRRPPHSSRRSRRRVGFSPPARRSIESARGATKDGKVRLVGSIPPTSCRDSPKGFRNIAQGCRAAATLGLKCRRFWKPQRGFVASRQTTQPFQGIYGDGLTPRVAAAPQPWAMFLKPFGLAKHNLPSPELAHRRAWWLASCPCRPAIGSGRMTIVATPVRNPRQTHEPRAREGGQHGTIAFC